MSAITGRHDAASAYPSARAVMRRVGWHLDTLAAQTLCGLGERAMARRHAREAGRP